MGSTSRASQFSKLHKVLAKHYQPVPVPERPVLEHLLFACCLENAPYPIAEEAFAGLIDIFYDWNEIRVSTIRELAEAMSRLPDPPSAASHLRSVLQDVFEANYTFDLESLKKLNLGPATEAIDKTKGVNSFIASYTVQSALGGHAIPLDSGALGVLQILGLATEKQVKESVIPGLERAIPKSKGAEFGSLLHQLSAAFIDNPFSTNLHKILLEIEPGCKDRLPKRAKKAKVTKKVEEAPAKKAAKKKAVSKGTAAKEEPAPTKKTAKAKAVKATEKKTVKKKVAKKTGKKTAAEKKTVKKKSAKRKIVATKKKKKATPKKKTATTKKAKSSSKSAKRKPR